MGQIGVEERELEVMPPKDVPAPKEEPLPALAPDRLEPAKEPAPAR